MKNESNLFEREEKTRDFCLYRPSFETHSSVELQTHTKEERTAKKRDNERAKTTHLLRQSEWLRMLSSSIWRHKRSIDERESTVEIHTHVYTKMATKLSITALSSFFFVLLMPFFTHNTNSSNLYKCWFFSTQTSHKFTILLIFWNEMHFFLLRMKSEIVSFISC